MSESDPTTEPPDPESPSEQGTEGTSSESAKDPEDAFPTSSAAEEQAPDSGLSSDLPLDPVDPATERDEYLAALQRVKAEFDNYKKRTERERAEMSSRAGERVISSILPVLDACQVAVAHDDEGVTAIFKQLMEALEKEGLVELDPVGEPFDPNLHEAVMTEESDGTYEVQTVVEVMRGGYSFRGRVIRPAMVKVQG